jgi:uncharacterized protein YbcC (UPF0753/DUF2309 family)
MQHSSTLTSPTSTTGLQHLEHLIDHAAHLLPAQGPITVFIHHNTLHAFEDLPFDEAVKKGGRVFGCHPFLTEDRYREALGRGRVRFADLRAVLVEDLGERAAAPMPGRGTRLDLRLAMLQYPLMTGPTEELVWFVAETDALRRVRADVSAAARAALIAETRRWAMRDLRGGEAKPRGGLADLFGRRGAAQVEDWGEAEWEGFTLRALWRVCCEGVRDLPQFTPPPAPPVRHRDLLQQATGADADALVHDLLIRFCGAFLDQGLAHWQLPRRDAGLYRSFCALYRGPGGPPDLWLRGLAGELRRLEDGQVGPLASIHESLELLGVPAAEWEEFVGATLLALRGWAGMIHQLETRGDRVVFPVPAHSLTEFLAVRLLLDRLALAHVGRDALGYTGPLSGLRDAARRCLQPAWPPSVEQRAFLVFQVAQVLGLSPDILYRLDRREWEELLEEMETFSGVERRRVFHLAYERRFTQQSLDAVALHAPHRPARTGPPRFQAVFCLDEREESIRRHLEEVAPDVETFGAAGFYGVAMYFRGAADAHFGPLCPIIITPKHWVAEQVVDGLASASERRALARRALGRASHRVHQDSRTFALGTLLTGLVGVLASFPLVARILFPRLTARLRRWFGRAVQPPKKTHLQLERQEAEPGPHNGAVGYTVAEMTAIAERQLRDMGLTSGFARLVLIHGHGSHSMNNPHESAHDCGACGGAVGGPNGRAIAQMLNDPRVRAGLAERGLRVPDETVFVGGLHNTCNEYIKYFDLDRLPESHRAEFDAAHADVERALDRNAHERARRFESAPLTITPAAARQHMDARAEDLAQVRPEWGHATNALCLVGRRDRTRGLYLDRRAFLTSYDPTQDDAEATILARILSAVFPVCAGISLEYYFSHVDSTGYGCGTKLPHNIAALLGVMDGAQSDLRTGLPWQMVEIHEPVRLVMVIETTPEIMLRIAERNPGIGRLMRNEWVSVSVQDPDSGRVSTYRDGRFVPYEPQATQLPRAASSVDWYRGWRDHLEFAEIGQEPGR